jgi:hypothetical protein
LLARVYSTPLLGELGHLVRRQAEQSVFGDVCITIPASRFDPALEPKLGALLVSVAADISADLRDSGFIRDA